MEKYKHIIASIVNNKPIEVPKHSSTETCDQLKIIEDLRKTNFRLQQEKAELEICLQTSQKALKKLTKHHQCNSSSIIECWPKRRLESILKWLS
jgi:uncharacterized pyridoxal phosphate-containing UPF0001 family protein